MDGTRSPDGWDTGHPRGHAWRLWLSPSPTCTMHGHEGLHYSKAPWQEIRLSVKVGLNTHLSPSFFFKINPSIFKCYVLVELSRFILLCNLPTSSISRTSSSSQSEILHLLSAWWDFPGGSAIKNLPCNARDAGSIPGWGTKVPHAAEQLSPRTAARVCAPNGKILHGTTQIVHVAAQTRHSQINK